MLAWQRPGPAWCNHAGSLRAFCAGCIFLLLAILVRVPFRSSSWPFGGNFLAGFDVALFLPGGRANAPTSQFRYSDTISGKQ